MTQERINDAIKAWEHISDSCAASCDIDRILDDPRINNFETNVTNWGETRWVNVDDIICAEVYRKAGYMEWTVSPHIEIVDDETDDFDGEDYDVTKLRIE